ncbi:carbohydrate kinase [Pedobacter yulinensis]|uniref:Carbohydrate kinase n=1 Tax=Pedobacter yulinensis TaxID=2126353 RepID=A0A2T3HS24_9SPHI|nr:FGGY-family carbohydrate kinase [Pedobacter yulinensis]PST85254.1 carbohydrate kinase [Pedobacter yulinensis]
MKKPFFIGIDIGTQGLRILAVDITGTELGATEETFPLSEDLRREQDPLLWWTALRRSMKNLIASVGSAGLSGISVTSTSGTVIPLDAAGNPLYPAIMYSDTRQNEEAAYCRQLAAGSGEKAFVVFNSSCGLPKMLWFVKNHPGQARHIRYWAHAADFIVGRLSGRYGVSDYTNVLKSGYDVANMRWPEWITAGLPVKQEWFPEVLPPGGIAGQLDQHLKTEFGIEQDVPVAAGMTDGCASQVASGAVKPGQWNSTIGTTLVLKGITTSVVDDPQGRLYSHRHPEGYWMPGGAANIGSDWVRSEFPGTDLDVLTAAAVAKVPTGQFSYPLMQQGERFPFIAPQARGFEPAGLDEATRFAAKMEGLAYVERYAFELAAALSGEKAEAVYSAGGGSNNPLWLQIRSNVLNLPLHKMENVTGALGAAILAASATYFGSLTEAAEAMTSIEQTVLPQPEQTRQYETSYLEFIGLLKEKGYLENETNYA